MSKSAIRFLVNAKVAPYLRLVRQDAFATDRTQLRKRPKLNKKSTKSAS